MRLDEADPGTYVARDWDPKNRYKRMAIAVPICGLSYQYLINGNIVNTVRKDSIDWDYDDFVYSDEFGTPLTKGTSMCPIYKNIKIIVAVNDERIQSFASEDDALQWITSQWAKQPTLKFTMFKPYQTVEPEIPDLSRFIKPIKAK